MVVRDSRSKLRLDMKLIELLISQVKLERSHETGIQRRSHILRDLRQLRLPCWEKGVCGWRLCERWTYTPRRRVDDIPSHWSGCTLLVKGPTSSEWALILTASRGCSSRLLSLCFHLGVILWIVSHIPWDSSVDVINVHCSSIDSRNFHLVIGCLLG